MLDHKQRDNSGHGGEAGREGYVALPEEGGANVPGLCVPGVNAADDERDDHYHLLGDNTHAALYFRSSSHPLYLPPSAPLPAYIQSEVTKHALKVRRRAALCSWHFFILYIIFTLSLV